MRACSRETVELISPSSRKATSLRRRTRPSESTTSSSRPRQMRGGLNLVDVLGGRALEHRQLQGGTAAGGGGWRGGLTASSRESPGSGTRRRSGGRRSAGRASSSKATSTVEPGGQRAAAVPRGGRRSPASGPTLADHGLQLGPRSWAQRPGDGPAAGCRGRSACRSPTATTWLSASSRMARRISSGEVPFIQGFSSRASCR